MINIICDLSFNFNRPYCGIANDSQQILFFLQKNKNYKIRQFALSKKPLPKDVETIKGLDFVKNKILGLFGKKVNIPTTDAHIFFCQNPNNYQISEDTKKITRIHDLIPIEYPKKVPLLSHILFRNNIFFNVAEKNNFFVCNSYTTRKSFLKFFPHLREKTSTIPCSSSFNMQDAVMEKPEIKISNDFFLVISSLEPKKNVLRLLKAYEILLSKEKQCKPLILVGNIGWKNKESVEYLHYLKNKYNHKFFHFQNLSKEQIAWLYHNCYCFIMPSLVEGFGIPVLDALAFSKPVLCSNIEVFHEITGKASLHFNPFSIEDIYNKLALANSNSNLMKDLAKKSKERYKKFLPEQIRNMWYNLIQNLYAK